MNVLRRFGSHTKQASKVNFVFDIDGVLTLGSSLIPRAKDALQLLDTQGIHYILMTNGGGHLESDRARLLSKQLGVKINENRLLQSHTPFKELVPQYQHQPILIIGGRGNKGREIAHAYGFKRPYIPLDFLSSTPSLYPFYTISENERSYTIPPASLEEIASIMVFHDSRAWGLDAQIIHDVIHLSKHKIKIYFSNPDLLWSNEYPLPRFGQGAFQAVVRQLCKPAVDNVEIVQYGKPTKKAYEWARRMLEKEAERQGEQLGSVIMVGDNPYSDIAGANAVNWISVLVRTGVFRGSTNSVQHPASHVATDVWEAVQWGLHNYSHSGKTDHNA